MNTRKKRKFKIHTGSVFKMAFKIAKSPLKGQKKIFKVCLVGTLNLCLKEPEKMQKTRNQSDHPRQRKPQKLAKFCQILIWQFFSSFLKFSQPRVIGFISSLLHLFRLLETQVQSTHKAYFEEFFFWPFKGVLAILKAILNTLPV